MFLVVAFFVFLAHESGFGRLDKSASHVIPAWAGALEGKCSAFDVVNLWEASVSEISLPCHSCVGRCVGGKCSAFDVVNLWEAGQRS